MAIIILNKINNYLYHSCENSNDLFHSSSFIFIEIGDYIGCEKCPILISKFLLLGFVIRKYNKKYLSFYSKKYYPFVMDIIP